MNDPLDTPLPPVPDLTLLEELNVVPNTPISPANSIAIGNFFAQLDQNVSTFDTTILGLQHRLQEVNDMKEHHISLKTQYRPLLSSIRRLPIELLAMIFHLHLDERLDDSDYPSVLDAFCPNPSPTVFTHVCRDWRTVALSNPQLWSQIRIFVKHDCTSGQLMLFQMWITRSGMTPLDLRIYIISQVSHRGETQYHTNEALLAILMTQIKRWKTVNLNLPSNLYFLPMFQNSALSAPLLESISMESTDGSGELPSEVFWSPDTPSLKAIFTNNLGVSMQNTSFDWSIPTELSLEQLSSKLLFHVLSQSKSRVSTLTIKRFWGDAHNLPRTPPMFILSQLTRFYLADASLSILSRITAPTLLTLSLSTCDPSDLHALLEFLIRSPLLKTLKLDHSTPHSFISAIRQPTHIRILDLTWFNREWEPQLRYIWHALLSDGSTSSSPLAPPFPDLETLKIIIHDNVKLEPIIQARDLVLSLARGIGTPMSRCPKLQCIQVILRQRRDPICLELLLSLKELAIPGLEIKVEDPAKSLGRT